MSANPLFGRAGRHGSKSERRVAKATGARATPGSGAFAGHKGDMRKARYLGEAKATIHESIPVQMKWLAKITKEATEIGCAPALFISFVTGSGQARPNGDWVLVPRHVWDDLTEGR